MDVLGVNCGVGPQVALDVIVGMAAVARTPLVAQPNAGFPGRVGGRIFYLSTPQYLADYARQLRRRRAHGCRRLLRHDAEHIARDGAALVVERARPRVVAPAPPAPGRTAGASRRARSRRPSNDASPSGAFVALGRA